MFSIILTSVLLKNKQNTSPLTVWRLSNDIRVKMYFFILSLCTTSLEISLYDASLFTYCVKSYTCFAYLTFILLMFTDTWCFKFLNGTSTFIQCTLLFGEFINLLNPLYNKSHLQSEKEIWIILLITMLKYSETTCLSSLHSRPLWKYLLN